MPTPSPTPGVEQSIREILGAHARIRPSAMQVAASADLFGAGLDSAAVVNVMLALEEALGFEFPEDRLNRAAFASIDAIAAVVDGVRMAA